MCLFGYNQQLNYLVFTNQSREKNYKLGHKRVFLLLIKNIYSNAAKK